MCISTISRIECYSAGKQMCNYVSISVKDCNSSELNSEANSSKLCKIVACQRLYLQ